MTDAAKAAMAAKRAATLVAKLPVIEPSATEPSATDEKKARKPREKMTDAAKAAMAAKRAATLAAKVPATDPAPTAEQKVVTPPAVKPKVPGAPKKNKKEILEPVDKPTSPPKSYHMIEVDGSFFMVHNDTQKVYRANLDKEGDERAQLDQAAGLFKDGEILPIFDDDE